MPCSCYDEYHALLTQNLSAAPEAVELKNTLSNEVTWERESAGEYYASIEGGFPVRTGVLVGGSDNPMALINAARIDDGRVRLTSMELSEPSDGSIARMLIEIRVYHDWPH